MLPLVASAAPEAQTVPESGPIAASTLQRLLLLGAARAGDRIVAVGDRGTIVYSDDRGGHWLRAKAPAAPLLTAVDFVDAQHGLAVGHDSVILATADRGESWTQVFAAPAEQKPLLDVMWLGPGRALAVGAYGACYESTDGGRTWAARKVIEDDKHLNALVNAGEGHLVILGEAGTIVVSPDAGRSWALVPSPYKGSLFGGVAAADGSLTGFGLRGHLVRSADRGATWKSVEGAPGTAALMGGDKLADGAIVLAGAAGTVLVSRDNGATYTRVAAGTTRAFSRPLATGAGGVLLFGETGARALDLPPAGAAK